MALMHMAELFENIAEVIAQILMLCMHAQHIHVKYMKPQDLVALDISLLLT
jgi:hypothetical protein